jgi:CRISPR system Cascade subunit CasD
VKTVLLRLEGPLQSWGTRSRFGWRDTENEPSKSGVLGLVGAALGMRRDDEATLGRLAASRLAVRVDREPTRMTDYHTVGDGVFKGRTDYTLFGTKSAVLTHRDYLMGASFLAALGFEDDALARRVDEALASPSWPLFLGRRSCPPSLPVFVPGGVLTAEPADVLTQSAFAGSGDSPERLRAVVECEPSHPDAEPRQDQPLSFRAHGRHYARRFVRTVWVDRAALPPPQKELSCISLVAS